MIVIISKSIYNECYMSSQIVLLPVDEVSITNNAVKTCMCRNQDSNLGYYGHNVGS